MSGVKDKILDQALEVGMSIFLLGDDISGSWWFDTLVVDALEYQILAIC